MRRRARPEPVRPACTALTVIQYAFDSLALTAMKIVLGDVVGGATVLRGRSTWPVVAGWPSGRGG